MFKKLKKIYFKIYHLFKLIGIFIIIFGLSKNVYADECINVLEYQNWSYKNSSTYYLVNDSDSTYFFTLDFNTDYILYFDNGTTSFNSILVNGISKVSVYGAASNNYNTYERFSTSDLSSTYLTFNSGTYRNINIRLVGTSGLPTSPFIDSNPHTLWLVKGSQPCSNNPAPSDNVYSDFITLYLDRISYLAEGFTTNPYLLTMVGIIIAWVVLELVLKILNLKGGKRK